MSFVFRPGTPGRQGGETENPGNEGCWPERDPSSSRQGGRITVGAQPRCWWYIRGFLQLEKGSFQSGDHDLFNTKAIFKSIFKFPSVWISLDTPLFSTSLYKGVFQKLPPKTAMCNYCFLPSLSLCSDTKLIFVNTLEIFAKNV